MATFGITTSYATSVDGWNDYKCACRAQLTEAGSVSKLTAYLGNQGAGYGACYVKGLIYTDSSTTPSALSVEGDAISIASNAAKAWVDLTFASPVALGVGYYWLGLIGDANADGLQLGHDNGSTSNHDWAADTYSDGASNPWGGTHNARTNGLCVYGTYTVPAGFVGLTVTRLLQG